MSTMLRKLMSQTCQRRKGEEGKNPQNLVNIVYECPLANPKPSNFLSFILCLIVYNLSFFNWILISLNCLNPLNSGILLVLKKI